MDIKPRPSHRLYTEILRRMTLEEGLMEALELSQFSRQLFSEGLRRRFPYLPASLPPFFLSPVFGDGGARSSGKGKIGEPHNRSC